MLDNEAASTAAEAVANEVPSRAVIVSATFAETALLVTVNVALLAPAATVTVAG